jgi:hypothetical protein
MVDMVNQGMKIQDGKVIPSFKSRVERFSDLGYTFFTQVLFSGYVMIDVYIEGKESEGAIFNGNINDWLNQLEQMQ